MCAGISEIEIIQHYVQNNDRSRTAHQALRQGIAGFPKGDYAYAVEILGLPELLQRVAAAWFGQSP